MKKDKSKLTRAELAERFARQYRFAEYTENVRKERKAVMLKRHAYFSSLAEDCQSLDEFLEQYGELFNIWGVELSRVVRAKSGIKGIAARMQLDYTEYETYYFEVIDGRVVVSPTLSWQNEVCANEDWNIFNKDSSDDNEEDEDDWEYVKE